MKEHSAYRKFAAMMLQEDSEYIPQILKCMINDAQAELLVSLPGTAAQMAEKLDRAVDAIQADLNDLFRKGLAFKKEKKEGMLWRAPAHLAQFHDASILWPEAPAEFYDLWATYMEKDWPKLAPVLTELMPRPYTRVIPVGKSVETGKVQVLAPENVRKIIDDAGRLAVTQCTCRLSMRTLQSLLRCLASCPQAGDRSRGLYAPAHTHSNLACAGSTRSCAAVAGPTSSMRS